MLPRVLPWSYSLMNPLVLLTFSIGLYLFACVISLLGSSNEDRAIRLSGVLTALGGLFGVIAAVMAISADPVAKSVASFSLPTGDFIVAMDGLAALMVLVISVVVLASALFSINYLEEYLGKGAWYISALFNVFAIAMVALVVSGSALYFMLFMELISLASFLIVISDGSQKSKQAGMQYFLMDHLGSVLIIAAFYILYQHTGSVEMATFSDAGLSAGQATLTFLLALVGFGIKASGILLHGWLPKAYPVAPSHCSTLISCVMVKIGIYGIIKVGIVFLGASQLWWGYLVLIFGALSSVFGVMYALAEHDIKRLLAYHTVENIGIILIGVGVCMVGLASQHQTLALLGLLGALYHLLNHAVFKGLLCLGSGSIVFRMHSKDMDLMGGLAKKMPYTALAFLIGTMAISALPPLNGFVSEWFIYQSLFSMSKIGSTGFLIAGPFAVIMLALTGALACMCFVKVYGICFSGAPKSARAELATEVGVGMVVATSMLAVLCIVLGVGSPWISPYISSVASSVLGAASLHVSNGATLYPANTSQAILSTPVIAVALLLLLVIPAVILFVFGKHRRSRRHAGDPWACGYQYEQRMTVNAGAITQPLRHFFSLVYRNRPQLSLIERFVLIPLGNRTRDGVHYNTMRVYLLCGVMVLFVLLFFPFISGVN